MNAIEHRKSFIDGCGNTYATPIDPRQLMCDLEEFRDPRPSRSGWELAVTLIPFLTLFALIAIAVRQAITWRSGQRRLSVCSCCGCSSSSMIAAMERYGMDASERWFHSAKHIASEMRFARRAQDHEKLSKYESRHNGWLPHTLHQRRLPEPLLTSVEQNQAFGRHWREFSFCAHF